MRQLPTIRSRCQLVRFRPLDEPTVARLLVAKNLVNDPKEAARLARYSEGSIRQAVELSDAELWNFRRELLGYLSAESLDSVGLAPKIAAFVDAAGKEAPARRARFRQVVGFAADFYRRMVFARSDLPPSNFCSAPADADRRAVGDGGRALSRRRDGRRRVPPALSRCTRADRPQRQPVNVDRGLVGRPGGRMRHGTFVGWVEHGSAARWCVTRTDPEERQASNTVSTPVRNPPFPARFASRTLRAPTPFA